MTSKTKTIAFLSSFPLIYLALYVNHEYREYWWGAATQFVIVLIIFYLFVIVVSSKKDE